MGIERVLDLFFPKKCVQCGMPGGFLCQTCFDQIEFLKHQYCPACGKSSVLGLKDHGCKSRSYLDQVYSLCWYRGVIRTVINRFKFEPVIRGLSEVIEKVVIRAIMPGEFDLWGLAVFTPVPLHVFSQRERGFNQSRLLAEQLSKACQNQRVEDLLVKERLTERQSRLTRQERRQNIRDAFIVNKKAKLGEVQAIVLVDDVYTSGSTLNECARILKTKGKVENVYAFTLARG